jgi:hypothetical protein
MGGLFSTPEAPAPKPVVAMPDPESDEARRAARRTSLQARSRSGRSSTVLSGEGDYESSTLGTG